MLIKAFISSKAIFIESSLLQSTQEVQTTKQPLQLHHNRIAQLTYFFSFVFRMLFGIAGWGQAYIEVYRWISLFILVYSVCCSLLCKRLIRKENYSIFHKTDFTALFIFQSFLLENVLKYRIFTSATNKYIQYY